MIAIRNRSVLLGAALVLGVGVSGTASAQTAEYRPTVWPGYPGAVLIAPQQANMTAPALYRTVNDVDNLEHPVGVSQICERDLELLRKKGIITTPAAVAAAGVQNQKSRIVGGKISLDATVAAASAEANYNQIVTLSTGNVQVFETDDDDVARTILSNVGPGCRKVIAGHLKQRRWVFAAAKAIQAYDYEAVFEREIGASASVTCGVWCRMFGGVKIEPSGKMTDKNRASASKQFVTIALVPAEIDARQSIQFADVGEPTPEPQVARLGRQARLAPAQQPRPIETAWAMWQEPAAAAPRDRRARR